MQIKKVVRIYCGKCSEKIYIFKLNQHPKNKHLVRKYHSKCSDIFFILIWDQHSLQSMHCLSIIFFKMIINLGYTYKDEPCRNTTDHYRCPIRRHPLWSMGFPKASSTIPGAAVQVRNHSWKCRRCFKWFNTYVADPQSKNHNFAVALPWMGKVKRYPRTLIGFKYPNQRLYYM